MPDNSRRVFIAYKLKETKAPVFVFVHERTRDYTNWGWRIFLAQNHNALNPFA